MKKRIKHKGAWFVNRIGKKIYKNPRGHLVVTDIIHAHLLYDAQDKFEIEYFDKPLKIK